MTKKITSVFLALLMLCAFTLPCFALSIPKPKENKCLYDGAKVLSEETANFIEQTNLAFENSGTGAQIGAFTINELPDGYDSEEYAYEIFNSWKIGDKQEENGMLLLLVPQQGKFWLAVGKGIDNHMPASVCNEILDNYLAEDFDNGYYDRAVKKTISQLSFQIENIYGIDVVEGSAQAPTQQNDDNGFGSDLAIAVFIVVVIIAFSVSFGGGRRRSRSTRGV
ncbi:MAG: TPM domain-containing protein, partial [Oscillospiraceae bacterium]